MWCWYCFQVEDVTSEKKEKKNAEKKVPYLLIKALLYFLVRVSPSSVVAILQIPPASNAPCCDWKYPYLFCYMTTVVRRARHKCILSVIAKAGLQTTPAGYTCQKMSTVFAEVWLTHWHGLRDVSPENNPPEVWSTVWSHEQVRAVPVHVCACTMVTAVQLLGGVWDREQQFEGCDSLLAV